LNSRRLATVAPAFCLAIALAGSTQLVPANVATANIASADVSITGTVTDQAPLKKGPRLAFRLASLEPARTSFEPALKLPAEQPSAELTSTSIDLLPASPDQMVDVQKQDVSAIETFDECFVVDVCVDRYLWALYQRAPKLDTITVQERRKVTIKRKGKKITVTRKFGRHVDEDFTWKDPHAADKMNLAMMDYVIGGMDRGFKLKLYHLLHAAEAAGLSPGITSAFRDDYRQEIASGLKAATNRSYHGGSLRGGYGHGMAADVVSTDGATRAARWLTTQVLWKWIDEHGAEYGVGRPYLDRDPPHLAPINGEEYAKHNPGKVKLAKGG